MRDDVDTKLGGNEKGTYTKCDARSVVVVELVVGLRDGDVRRFVRSGAHLWRVDGLKGRVKLLLK